MKKSIKLIKTITPKDARNIYINIDKKSVSVLRVDKRLIK